jgi:hypothetical protein
LFSIYGAVVRIENCCPSDRACAGLADKIDQALGVFSVARSIGDPVETHGVIRPFEISEVMQSLSRATASMRYADRLVEIYSNTERHWLLDDRWGVCEIDLLKHRWRSWIIPGTTLDAVQLAEAAVVWPMAQLLRLRGIELVPVISVERSGWGALVFAPYPIPREIHRIIRAGYRVVGQRWTALMRQGERIVMRHIPGLTESPAESRSIRSKPVWTDLLAGNPWSSAEVAWCDAVLAIVPGRRSKSCGRIVPSEMAGQLIRRVWPICELPVGRMRVDHPALFLGEQCLCLSLQLSRHEDEFLELIELARHRTPVRAQVSIHKALRRSFSPAARRVA